MKFGSSTVSVTAPKYSSSQWCVLPDRASSPYFGNLVTQSSPNIQRREEADDWLAEESAVKPTRSIPLLDLSRSFDDIHSTVDNPTCLSIVGTAFM